jgi:hypothetical protein
MLYKTTLMNWKLIFLLSLFGLAMGISTVFWITQSMEPYFWIAVLIITAWLIARRAPGKYFLHGLFVGLANCVWVIAAHVYWYATYLGNHPQMVEMMRKWPLADHPRRAMVLFGPIYGIISGIVIGLVALLLAAVMGKKKPAAA